MSVVHPTWARTRADDPADQHCGWAFRSPQDPPMSSPSGVCVFVCVCVCVCGCGCGCVCVVTLLNGLFKAVFYLKIGIMADGGAFRSTQDAPVSSQPRRHTRA